MTGTAALSKRFGILSTPIAFREFRSEFKVGMTCPS